MRLRTFILYIAAIVLIICAVGFGSLHYVFGGLEEDTDFQKQIDNMTEIDNEDDDSERVATTLDQAKIRNIAIFGIDSPNGDQGRSDATLVISVDNEHNKIKITSLARDSLVYIPQKKTREKLTHAYSYGGPSLAVYTINKNFNLDIKDYVAVNFQEMADIVDLVGGVQVNLSQAEYNYLKDPSLSPGDVTLNGQQAVRYSRIRYIDSDIMRASRQREVLTSLFYSARSMKKTAYPAFIRKCMALCSTSLSKKDILSMASILSKSGLELEQFSCPADLPSNVKVWGGIMDSGAWCWVYNTKKASASVLDFIYEDIYRNSGLKLPKATVTTDLLTDSEWSRNVA